jgi:enoyl-CoA hydratase/carnithine racemase
MAREACGGCAGSATDVRERYRRGIHKIVRSVYNLEIPSIAAVVPAESLLDAAWEMARRIAERPPHALRLGKSLLRHGQATSYDTLLEMSAAAQAISHLTDDHAEGVAALLEERRPKFAD